MCENSIYAQNFNRLADIWEQETKYLSNVSDMSAHFAYQKIIKMGYEAIPLILERLAEKPGHWFYALAIITDENPVDKDDSGDFYAMTTAWLNWGKEQGYKF